MKTKKISNKNKIIIITILTFVFQYLRYNDFYKGLTGTFVVFGFSFFISFLISRFIGTYRETNFFNWWLGIYLIMFIGAICSWLLFGNLN